MTDKFPEPMEELIGKAARNIEPRPEFTRRLWTDMDAALKVTRPDRRPNLFTPPGLGYRADRSGYRPVLRRVWAAKCAGSR